MSMLWVLLLVVPSSSALDNGLALTPPMGWMSWLKFQCNTDCVKYPKSCISEELIMRTADKMSAAGYRDAGYEYVIVDDCWLSSTRRDDGGVLPDNDRFKSGIRALADYVHSKKLKFGIYEDVGVETCQGLPGVENHEAVVAQEFAEWGVDYVKMDGCNMKGKYDVAYPKFGKMMNETGHPMVYSCSWPAYQSGPNYTAISDNCNLWRMYTDIVMSFDSIEDIIHWVGDNQEQLAPVAGPGHWNDPDMLIVGNPEITVDQARVQMSIWSIVAAPLLMSVDMDQIEQKYADILLNKDVIAVNQDKLGKQGLRVYKVNTTQIWNRELSDGSNAIAFLNLKSNSSPSEFMFTLKDMKLPEENYEIQDLYKEDKCRTLELNQYLDITINSPGAKFYKFIPRKLRSKM